MAERFEMENRARKFDPKNEDADLTNWGIVDHEEGRFASFGNGRGTYGTVREWTDRLNQDSSFVTDLHWTKLV